jgi:hypothetical protein
MVSEFAAAIEKVLFLSVGLSVPVLVYRLAKRAASVI